MALLVHCSGSNWNLFRLNLVYFTMFYNGQKVEEIKISFMWKSISTSCLPSCTLLFQLKIQFKMVSYIAWWRRIIAIWVPCEDSNLKQSAQVKQCRRLSGEFHALHSVLVFFRVPRRCIAQMQWSLLKCLHKVYSATTRRRSLRVVFLVHYVFINSEKQMKNRGVRTSSVPQERVAV